jgi:hypothetical protein
MKPTLKSVLGSIPYTADLYDAFRRDRPRTRYNLEQLAAALPAAVEQVRPYVGSAPKEKKLLLFATLHYWVEQAAMVGLALRGHGHDVTVAYLPYSDWRKDVNSFDLRRQDLYTQRVLQPLRGLVNTASLLELQPTSTLPANLTDDVRLVSTYDAQYTLQVEDVDENSDLFRLRLARNDYAARAALAYIQSEKPDVVLIPNGTITELGAVYRVARHLGMRTVTYEFNDQREQVWIAQDDEVMRQCTDDLWAARGGHKLTDDQRNLIEELESARMGAKAFGKSVRKWQDVEALPSIPEHIHIIGPLEKVNTYDLMEIASLGLVYTTTTGMEMSMNGIPVIVCGDTHYARRGFTLDPPSWGEYYDMLDAAIKEPKRLTQEQIETAWEYAYRFFFEYPLPFPWRLMHFWKDLDIWPLDRVLSDEGRAEYKQTFDYLAGEPIIW